MPVFRSGARSKADRAAAIVGILSFGAGVLGIAWTNSASTAAPATAQTTVVSSPIPGDPVTTTVQNTTPPVRATLEPKVTQEVTVTEGGGEGSMIVTTGPVEVAPPFLGSTVANLAFQVLLVALASLLLAFGTQRVLLGEYGVRRTALPGGGDVIDEDAAAAVKREVLAAGEAADLSRPLFARRGIPDARLALLESRIALEQEVRTLAQHNDLPSGLTVPYVVRGLVSKKRMSSKLASAVVELSEIGDRIGRGAELSLDTTTLLTEAYSQALARVGGKIRVRG